MFLEVPNINNIKRSEIFKIIRTKTGLNGFEFYPVTEELIYLVKDREDNNFLTAKLIKNIIKNEIENFIVCSIIKIKDKESLIESEKLFIFSKDKGNINFDFFPVDKTSLLSIVMSHIDSKDLQIFYIINKQLSDIISDVIKISRLDEDIFIETKGELKKEDFDLLIKDKSGIIEEIEKYKEDFNRIFKIKKKEKKEKITNPNKKTLFKKQYVIPTVVVSAICLGGIYGLDYYNKMEAAKLEEIEKQKDLELKQHIKPKINTVKLKNNLMKSEMIKYFILNNDNNNTLSVKYSDKKLNLILDKNEYLDNSKFKEVKTSSRFLTDKYIYLKNLDYKTLLNNLNIKLSKEQNKLEKSTDYFLLSNDLNAMYIENNKDFVIKIKMNKEDLLLNLDKIFSDNNSDLNFLLTYIETSNEYFLTIYNKGKAVTPPLPTVSNEPIAETKPAGQS